MSFLVNRCPACGMSAQTICPRCWYILNEVGAERTSGLFTTVSEQFVQRALFRWDDRVEKQASILREVILSSKEHPSNEMMSLWAEEFVKRGTLDGSISGKRNWLVLPPPGRSGVGEADHSGGLAEALAQSSSGYFIAEIGAFEHVGKCRGSASRSQKSKTKNERAEIEFRISRLSKKRLERAAGFIFIDDVLATGATATAAWHALGRPRAFECWTVAAKVKEVSLGAIL